METLKNEKEKQKIEEGIRKIQESLHRAIQEKQYWGMDQKIAVIQKSFILSQRI